MKVGMFSKATRKKAKLRLALCGTSGSGKTYSALLIAKGIGGNIALIDTENGSGSLYEHLADYDVAEIHPPFTTDKYITAIREAEKSGYNVLIIDSLSHAWAGQGGLLEEVDKRKSNAKNSFTAWRDVTPMHNKLVDTILQSGMHIIVTMRTKTAYEMEKDERGKIVPVKMGMAPVQRDGLEYEFTVVLDLDNAKHVATAGKDRTGLFDGKVFVPCEGTGQELLQWLDSGVEPPERPKPTEDAAKTQPAKQSAVAGVVDTGKLRTLANKAAKSGMSETDLVNLVGWKFALAKEEMSMQQFLEVFNKLDELWKQFVEEQSGS